MFDECSFCSITRTISYRTDLVVSSGALMSTSDLQFIDWLAALPVTRHFRTDSYRYAINTLDHFLCATGSRKLQTSGYDEDIKS